MKNNAADHAVAFQALCAYQSRHQAWVQEAGDFHQEGDLVLLVCLILDDEFEVL